MVLAQPSVSKIPFLHYSLKCLLQLSSSFKRYHHFNLCVDSKKLITSVKSIAELISGYTNLKYLDTINLMFSIINPAA